MLEDLYKSRWGDRSDGWRVTGNKGLMVFMPFFQQTRSDAQCFFSELIDLEPLEKMVSDHKEDIPGLSIMHIFIAAMVRLISQRPYLNRFLINSILYAHKDIQCSFMIKKTLDDKGEESPVRPKYSPFDTLRDVVEKNSGAIDAYKAQNDVTDTDKIVKVLSKFPMFVTRFIVWYLRFSDRHGFLPKIFHDISPYHTSFCITNVGSLGINSIFHHLYEFGTCSVFFAIGRKVRRVAVTRDGKMVVRKFIELDAVIDERICDGHYNALSFRQLLKLLQHPEDLLTPPDKIVLDDGIDREPLYTPTVERARGAG